MNPDLDQKNHRILVIDDNRAIHDDFRKILGDDDPLAVAEARLFGMQASTLVPFELDFASQGEEGLARVQRSLAEGRPYAMAFIDVRMPPGWDGIETTKRVWEIYPDLQVVICTAYSDYSWAEVNAAIRQLDQLLILKKPFDPIEVVQLVHALTAKWRLHQDSRRRLGDLQEAVAERTRELEASRIAALNMMEDAMEAQKRAEGTNDDLLRQMAEGKRAEERICEQARLLDLAHDAILVRDLEDRIQFWSAAAQRLYGWTSGEACGGNIGELIYRDTVAYQHAKKLLLQRGEWSGELQQVTKDGRQVLVDSRWTLVRDAQGAPKSVLVINTDITEKRKVEEQLRQAQKMEAIGQLAGGIAHDFNNILGCIFGYTELAAMEANVSTSVLENLQEVLKASQRAKELVQQILTFSRQQEQERKPIRLQGLIKEVLKLLRASLPATIEIRAEIQADAPPVLADATQMHQIIMNLATNAAHAMSGRPGQLTVRLANAEVDDRMVEAGTDLRPGEYVVLAISDTGCGMSKATLQRIFDPFFTTKAPGEGTGLGLSVVHGIVKSHDGAITVESQTGQGTTFHVYFPSQRIEESEIPRQSASIPHGNGQRVMFVDDEPALARLGKKLLQRAGYHVTIQTSALEALAAFLAEPSAYDLVVTDLTMPNMTGADLASELLKRRPDLPILLATGFGRSMNSAKAEALGVRELLLKPLTAQGLAEAAHRVLAPMKGQETGSNCASSPGGSG